MALTIVPVILSGGSGSRLWPLSRELFPKQLHRLWGDATLIQHTAKRAAKVTAESPIVVCNAEHRFMIREQLEAMGRPAQRIILEPVGRNTAAAIAAVAYDWVVQGGNPQACFWIMPSDHMLEDTTSISAALIAAETVLNNGAVLTFGIKPTEPATGFGYIEVGGDIAAGVAHAQQFVEKPDEATAQGYLEAGNFVWNSGMFVMRCDHLLKGLESHAPKVTGPSKMAVDAATIDLGFLRLANSFADSENISFDYALMEKAEQVVVAPLDVAWSDVGAWSALDKVIPADKHGNVIQGDVIVEESKGSVVYSNGHLVAVLGIEDLIVVETHDAVMVAPKARAQDVKLLVKRLKSENRKEALVHHEVFRPWGSYQNLSVGDRYQVKKLVVKPGATLSLQKHHHRAEHWVVVRGTAEITRGDETFLLSENESTYIPIGTMHRIANPGQLEAEIIEVQSGSYLGEDDIVRYEDTYGRSGETPKA